VGALAGVVEPDLPRWRKGQLFGHGSAYTGMEARRKVEGKQLGSKTKEHGMVLDPDSDVCFY
jgi:hypothetical protein